MGWLVPLILLVKGENRPAQVKALLTGVGIPILAILVFVGLWSVSSKQIVTKFGTVPGPRQVASAWGSLMNEIRLENIKEADHLRRSREKRLQYLGKYESVLESLPGGNPQLGNLKEVEGALAEYEMAFVEINEVLDVSNALTIQPDVEAAIKKAEEFRQDSSQALAQSVLAGLLPAEIKYKTMEEDFRMNPKYNASSGDTEAEQEIKSKANKKRFGELASEKAELMILRQRTTSRATRKAVAILESTLQSANQTLSRFDERAANLFPRMESWYAQIVEGEETTGEKNKDKMKVKMIMKGFDEKPYPGKDTYPMQIATSLKTVFTGFLIASAIAIPLGVLCGLNRNINNAFNPLIQIFKPVSPLAWLPLVMIVVGALYVSDDPAFEMSFINSAITVALCSLWPTLVNTAVGVASTDKDFLNVAKVLKLSWFKKITHVVLPASLPLVFTGLRLSLGVGWMVLIAAEMLAQNPGLGKFVWDMFQNGSSETLSMIMVAVFTIGVIGFFLDTVMMALQQWVSYEEVV